MRPDTRKAAPAGTGAALEDNFGGCVAGTEASRTARQSAGGPVTLTQDEYDALRRDADCWRTLMSSPHTASLIGEYIEWCERRDMSEVAADLAAAMDWRAYASGSVSYRQLEERRGGAPHRCCDYKLCTEGGTPHRSPQTGAQIVLCASHSHHGVPEQQEVPTVQSGKNLRVVA